jgi:pimeloyl-ACP methyl ester carboxylesterase
VDFDYVVMPATILTLGILVICTCVSRMRSLHTKSYRPWRKVSERIVLSLIVLLSAAVAGSSSLNAIAIHHFWAMNPPAGQMVPVDGHKMHINCTGDGSPTLVLEAGGGNDSLIWGGVQPELSKTSRVCSYDRAGFGWSDAVPGSRDADHIAAELHQLLLQTGITGPIVLMGHSIAGLYMRDYATRYPKNVVGIVFVDASTPLQEQNAAMQAGEKGPPAWFLRSALILGVPRLIGMCSKPSQGAGAHTRRLQAEDICRIHFSAMAAELDSFHQSGEQTVHSGPYGALPILIFSHDPSKLPGKQKPTQQSINRQNAWSEMQEDLKKLSSRSCRIIAEGSTHNVMLDRDDLIKKEVPLFIDEIRGIAPHPISYGSTITE